MGIVILNPINDGMYLSQMMMIEVIVLITLFLTIAGFTIYLVGITWLCVEEKRRSITARPRARLFRLSLIVPRPLKNLSGQ